jgi:hypothetical protein
VEYFQLSDISFTRCGREHLSILVCVKSQVYEGQRLSHLARLRVHAVDLFSGVTCIPAVLFQFFRRRCRYLLGRCAILAVLSPSRKSTKEFTLKILFRVTCLASVSIISCLRKYSQFVVSAAFTSCESTWYRIAKRRAGSE